MITKKIKVCTNCYSTSIYDKDCICTYTNNYPTIELEFNFCECCGQIMNDGDPDETEFNLKQWEKLCK